MIHLFKGQLFDDIAAINSTNGFSMCETAR